MRYKDIICETPQAIAGNWSEGDMLVYDIGLSGYRANWKKVGIIATQRGNFDISQCRSTFIVGSEQPSKPPSGKFSAVARIDLDKITTDTFGYKNLYSVDGVTTKDTERGTGMATELYRYIVKSDIVLMSDQSQYFGKRKLWSRLSKQTDMVVDVLDTKKQAVVERNVEIHQGNIDSDFDNKYWSYDIRDGKENIRFVLREIK